nr:hypothetical protein [Clostridium perfringens]
MDDFIYDYLEYIGQKVKVCEGEGCNKRILVKGKRDKYCKECQRKKELEWKRESIKKARK